MLARPGLPSFEYVSANTPADAAYLLREHGEAARLLMGGTDLLVRMRDGLLRPRVVLDVKGLPGIAAIQYQEGVGLTVGAAATMNQVAHHPDVQSHYPLLAEAANAVASYQLRNRATIGGNLANASPAADTAPATLVLEGQIVLYGAEGERAVPADQFFLGPGQSARQPGEYIAAVRFPPPPDGAAGCYLKLGRNRAGDLAIVGVAVLAFPDAEAPSGYRFRIALASVAPVPLRVLEAEAVLADSPPGEQAFARAADGAREAASPIDDVRASAAYRRAMVHNLTLRGLRTVWRRLQGEVENLPGLPRSAGRSLGAIARGHRCTEGCIGGRHEIIVTVNGEREQLVVPANATLLEMLRERLALTGTKNGCSAGECGACTVLLNGEPVNACMVLAAEVGGAEVVTVEGLAQDVQLDIVQQAFVDEGAVQCGFCTPGMLISARALLDRSPRPGEDEIREALVGNLCRCTGYTRIVRAVQRAAQAER